MRRPCDLALILIAAGCAGASAVEPSAPAPPVAPDAEPAISLATVPERLVEGQELRLAWDCSPAVYSVAVTASFDRTPLGGHPRGRETIVVQTALPQPQPELAWRMPWLDTTRVRLKLKAFATDASLLAVHEVPLRYVPAAMAGRQADGIYVHLTNRRGQRLYLVRDGTIVRAAICSGAAGGSVASVGSHPARPHDHHGVFRVQGKVTSCRSSLNQAWLMRYVLRYHNGHAIHATTPGYYRLLGRPASHGCIRLHLRDAVALYRECPVGTRVEIF